MRALITGCSGQDGSYLSELLVGRGWQVYGLIRGQDNPRADWLRGLAPGIELIPGDLLDDRSLHAAVAEAHPDVVFNLAAISSPGLAWRQPTLTGDVTGLGALRLFQAVYSEAPWARVVQASSLATHGPYGAAKAFAHIAAQDYRTRALHISCAVFGGHHSPRRGRSFFARKVTAGVAAIRAGQQQMLELGSLSRVQDWGRAPDFVAQLPHLSELDPGDYIMSTGDPRSAEDWVATAFALADMDWRDHVKFDPQAGNTTDVPRITAPPDPRLGWEPDRDFTGLIRWMLDAEP